jgi:hypothetical protein
MTALKAPIACTAASAADALTPYSNCLSDFIPLQEVLDRGCKETQHNCCSVITADCHCIRLSTEACLRSRSGC